MAKFKTGFLMGLLAGYVVQSLKKQGVAGGEASRTIGQTGSNELIFNVGRGPGPQATRSENIEGAERIAREI